MSFVLLEKVHSKHKTALSPFIHVMRLKQGVMINTTCVKSLKGASGFNVAILDIFTSENTPCHSSTVNISFSASTPSQNSPSEQDVLSSALWGMSEQALKYQEGFLPYNHLPFHPGEFSFSISVKLACRAEDLQARNAQHQNPNAVPKSMKRNQIKQCNAEDENEPFPNTSPADPESALSVVQRHTGWNGAAEKRHCVPGIWRKGHASPTAVPTHQQHALYVCRLTKTVLYIQHHRYRNTHCIKNTQETAAPHRSTYQKTGFKANKIHD